MDKHLQRLKDNEFLPWLAGILFGLFLLGVLSWTITLTLFVMDQLLPNTPTKWVAISLFDGGALVWAFVYALRARGDQQRNVSLLMTLVDLAGVMVMVYAAIEMGNDLRALPPETVNMIIRVIIWATIANVLAGYYFHLNAHKIKEAIHDQRFEDLIYDEARKQAETNVAREARAMGAVMAQRSTAGLKYRLMLPMTDEERQAWEEGVIDVQPTDVLPQLEQKPNPIQAILVGVLGFFGLGRNSRPREDASTPMTSELPADPFDQSQSQSQSQSLLDNQSEFPEENPENFQI